MLPALDVRVAVGAGLVADGQVEDAEVELRGTEEEVEVAEGVKVPEVVAVLGDEFVVFAEEDFGAAEGVLDALPEEVGEGVGSSSGGMVRSASKMKRRSPVAAAKASRQAPPLPLLCCLRSLMLRWGYFWATRWISSQVLSLEWPSMKRISVPRPSSGVRRTAASMLPASFRAGMTTEQV